jgi:DNA-3-methyladenine glycosylase I
MSGAAAGGARPARPHEADAGRVRDERLRCWWTGDPATADPAMVRYHDEEWGGPVSDDTELFERLILECFQAGLSWSTILRKRVGFRAAFAGFDPATVAAFDDTDRQRLLADAGIVRNRAKVDATIANAAAFLDVVAEHGSFAAYLGSIVGRPAGMPAPPRSPGTTMADIAPTTPESDALSADLKRRGFRFVGPTIVYAFMQSVGLVDDHLPECWRYRG